MTRTHTPGNSRSLAHRLTDLEKQSAQRRLLLRPLITGIKRKIAAQMTTPSVLLTAVGIGAAMEQTGHHSGWTLATVLDAANASIRLLLAFDSPDKASR
jgi:hypothetical protein